MSFASEVLGQLRKVHAEWELVHGVVADYQVAVQKSLDLEVRIRQLIKENAVLRDECEDKENTISQLNQRVKHAQEEIRTELVAVKSENEFLSKDKEELRKKLSDVTATSFQAEERVEELEKERGTLQQELKTEREAREVAVTEWKAGRQEMQRTSEQMNQMERDNKNLLAKILQDQECFAKKWQEVTDLEAEVQRTKTQLDAMEAQLMLERELSEERVGFVGYLKRKRHPFAKRLNAYANLIERGEMDKALQALDVLLLEMKNPSPDAPRPQMLHPDSIDSVLMPVDDVSDPSEQLPEYCSFQVQIPTIAHGMPKKHQGGCSSCTVTANGSLCATGGFDRQVMLWDPDRMHVKLVLKGMAEGVRDVSFTSTGESILAAGSDKSVRLWNTHSGESKWVLTGHARAVNCVNCDPCDQNKALSCGDDRQILFWDLNRGYRIQNVGIRLEEWAAAVCFDNAGHVISGHSKGNLRLWDLRSDSRPTDISNVHNDAIVALYPLPLSTQEFITAGKDNKLALFDFRKNQVVRTYTAPQFYIGTTSYLGKAKSSISVSRDERFIAAGSTAGKVMIWDKDKAMSNQCAQVLVSPFRDDIVTAVAWAGDRLLACDRAGNSIIWSQSQNI